MKAATYPHWMFAYGAVLDFKIPKRDNTISNDWILGELRENLVGEGRLRQWGENLVANPLSSLLGNIAVKEIGFPQKWFAGCFQICV